MANPAMAGVRVSLVSRSSVELAPFRDFGSCSLVGPSVTRLSLSNSSIPGSVESATTPGNRGPNPLMQIIPGNLCNDLKSRNRAGDFDPSGEEPANRECVEGSERAPADRLEN
jgi:hypothetical protein